MPLHTAGTTEGHRDGGPRAHAFEAASRHESAAERDRALTRLLDYYVHTASAAMSVAYPYEASQTLLRKPHPMASPFDERGNAAAWLDQELANLLACAESGRAIDLSAALHNHLRARGRYAQAEWLHGRAIEQARELGDSAHEVRSLNFLGGIQNLQGRYEPATDCFERAVKLASQIGDAGQQAEATWGLGYLNYMNGRHQQAGVHYGLALRWARKQKDVVREIHALRGLGHVNYSQADYAQGEKYFDDALRISRRIGHHVVEMDALRGLGIIHLARGQHDSSAW